MSNQYIATDPILDKAKTWNNFFAVATAALAQVLHNGNPIRQ
jgi:hypothetical protein